MLFFHLLLMWPINVINLLSEKIKDCEPSRFDYFLNQVFINLKKPFGETPIPVGILLGVTEKIYSKYYRARNESVKIGDFIKYLIGLLLLYTKYEFDYSIGNNYFITSTTLVKFIDEPINNIERNVWKDLHYSLNIDFINLAKALSNQPKELLEKLREEIIHNIQQEPTPYNIVTTSPLYELIRYMDDFINEEPFTPTPGRAK